MIRVVLIMYFCFEMLFTPAVHAQMSAEQFQVKLELYASGNVKSDSGIKAFYKNYGYQYAWIDKKPLQEILINYLRQSPELGLQKLDYHFALLSSINEHDLPVLTAEDSIKVEFRFTEAAIHFFRDVMTGNKPVEIRYNGLNYNPDCFDIPGLLTESVRQKKFHAFLSEIECRSPEYQALKQMLIRLTKANDDTLQISGGLIGADVVSGSDSIFLNRLVQFGLLNTVDEKLTDEEFTNKVKEVQHFFSLKTDGIPGKATLAALNKKLSIRIAQLEQAINTIRWLRCIRQQSEQVIVVNIPSANLLVYGPKDVALESKVIVGRKSKRTPVFCSRVTEVVLYPYWMVPNNIATKELLPLIRRNPRYLEENNFQVITADGRITDPSTITWDQLSTAYFPYKLRQSTGCDNSLGLVKLNFYTPFGVYLHDTPQKFLFKEDRRFFSHGCIRVEKAIELAHLALKDNTIAIDSVEEKGCVYNQQPIPVPATLKMPVFVLYNTAWVDSSASVRFFEDIYLKYPSQTR